MSTNDAFDRQLRDWLSGEATRSVPPGLAETVVASTGHRRPRPAWLVALRGAGYGSTLAGGIGGRDLFGRPMAVVWLAALLVLALVAGILAFGASHNPFLVTASDAPSASALVAVASSTPSFEACPGTTGAWPAPSVPAGSTAEPKPGLLAGWGQVGTRNDGTLIFDVFTFDPFQASGPGALRRVTTLELSSAKERVLDWAPDGSALDVDWSSGTTTSGCTETFVVAGGQLYRPFPMAPGEVGFTDGAMWSPDGSRLASVRYHGDFSQPVGNFVIANRDGSAPESLPIICTRCQPTGGTWSPDGTILAAGYENISVDGTATSLGVAFYTFSTREWETHEFRNVGSSVLGWLDGHHLLVDLTSDGVGKLAIVSPHTPGEQQVGTGYGSLAPDGKVAVLETDTQVGDSYTATLSVVDVRADVGTGIARPLPAGGPWPEIEDIVWAPDESAVVLGVFDPHPLPALGDRTGTWLVPLNGSPARQLTGPEFAPKTWQPVWTP